MKNELKVHKITPYTNSENEERILLTATKEVEMLGGLASNKSFGSIVLKKGTSEKKANEMFKVGAELEGVKFGAMDDEGFYRIVPA